MARPVRSPGAFGLVAQVPLVTNPDGGVAFERNLGMALPDVNPITADHTLIGRDHYAPCDTSGGAIILTLPPAVATTGGNNAGAVYLIEKVTTDANGITITPDGTDTINGVNASLVLKQPYGAYLLRTRGVGVWTASPYLARDTTKDPIAYRRVSTPLTPLTSAEVSLDANWGTGPSVSIGSGSNDLSGQVNITVGTTPGGSPVATVTFKDGAWPVAPKGVLLCRAGNGTATWGSGGVTTTTFQAVRNGTPTGGAVERFIYQILP